MRTNVARALQGNSREDEVVEVARAYQDGEIEEVDEAEQHEITSRTSRIAAAIFSQSDEAGEGRHGGPEPSYVDGDEKVAVIGGEFGKQDGGGHVADDLAGRGADEQRGKRYESAERRLHRGDAREVARKHEESAEREEQGVVHPEEGFGFQHEERDGDGGEPDIKREHPENYEHREREEYEIHRHPPYGRRGDFGGLELHPDGSDEEAGEGYEHERHPERKRHYLEKLLCRDGIVGIKIEVLRIAERGEHPAEIGGYVLHDEDESGVLSLPTGGQHIISEGQEGDERHIVCHDHGAEIRDENEGERDSAHIAERGDYLSRQPLEEPALFERADHGEGAEEAGQGVGVEVVDISRVRRHEEAGHHGGDRRYDEDHMALQQPEEDIHSRRRRVSAYQYAHTEGYLYTFFIKKASV